MAFFTDDFADTSNDDVESERLRTVNANLETVAYALSHDLRAPLRAIDGFAQALREEMGDGLNDAVSRNLNEIRAGVNRMQEMINKWLGFIRSESTCLQRESVSLSALAQSVVDELHGAEPQRTATITIRPDMLVQGDRVLLRELLQNLIGNAWKFTESRVDAVIELGMCERNGTQTYFLRDNGVGLAANDAQRIFEPFVRLHDAESSDGTGIGLTIVQRIVEAHGGVIWAEGEPGEGATFYFTLPGTFRQPSLCRVQRRSHQSCHG